MAQERSPLGEFEIRGTWWLPENPDNRVAGVLSYRPRHMVNLELDSPLHNPFVTVADGIESLWLEPIRSEAMLGTGLDGALCTLLNTVESGTTVLARYLLLGNHFECEKAATFESAEFHLTGLEEWTGQSPLVPTIGMLGIPLWLEMQKEPEKAFSINIAYKKATLLEFEVPSRGCRIWIGSGVDVSTEIYHSLTITHAASIFVQPSAPQPLAWYRRFFVDCSRLFSFLTGRSVRRTKTVLSTLAAAKSSRRGDEVELYDEARRLAIERRTEQERSRSL
ncbi:MAG: hypothetical protein ACRD3T_05470 [Terriglobia bacterium]